MQMDEGMDTGDILLSQTTRIASTHTTGDLWHRLANMGASLLIETLKKMPNITPIQQISDAATYAPLLKKEDGLIDFSHSSENIFNLVRGVDPWPGAWCFLGSERLKIWKTEVVSKQPFPKGNCGEVVSLQGPVIQTGDGYLRLLEVQLAGKKRGPASNLVHGNRISLGSLLQKSPS